MGSVPLAKQGRRRMEDRRHRGHGEGWSLARAWRGIARCGPPSKPGREIPPPTGRPQDGYGGIVQLRGKGDGCRRRGRDAGTALSPPGRPWEGILQSQPPKQGRPTAMPGTSLQILVRETGLEPVWMNRWILSPVRLPIPPLSQRPSFYHRHHFPASLGQPSPQYRTTGDTGPATGPLRRAVLASWRAEAGDLSAGALPSQTSIGGGRGA